MDPLRIVARVRSWDPGDPPCTDDIGAVSGRFTWDAYDPVAVRLTLELPDFRREVPWIFARDLLRDGLREPAGVGDVAVWTDDGHVSVRLDSPDGICVLTIRNNKARIGRWVGQTYDAVPDDAVDYGRRVDRLLAVSVRQFTRDDACRRNACDRCHRWEARS